MRKFLFVIYLVLSTSLISISSRASTLFAPDSDTALLFNLVSNTASQLNELEKLVKELKKKIEAKEKGTGK